MIAKVIYDGNLRTTATHTRSGTIIETDAPIDNGGKGERFSPTDLLCTALASCMCTVMDLAARDRGIVLGDISCDVEKVMGTNPRRINEIKVNLLFQGPTKYSHEERTALERAALTCPVFESLHPECKKMVLFIWP